MRCVLLVSPHGRGITALLIGPSGTGKTLATEILANHLRLASSHIDVAGVISRYIGETEKNLGQVFAEAEGGGTVLFFDEADGVFGKRSEVKAGQDRYANIEVNYLRQGLEDYAGTAILTRVARWSYDWVARYGNAGERKTRGSRVTDLLSTA
jgi:SpoVK/Ycf46/Vps4 family AAA+-type ATPase